MFFRFILISKNAVKTTDYMPDHVGTSFVKVQSATYGIINYLKQLEKFDLGGG
jgi:hypothetical protein